MTKSLLLCFFMICLIAQPFGQITVPQQAVSIKTNEMLLDVLVHDKKGKIIRDLKPEEIEVFEDGEPQSISSFRFIEPLLNNAKSANTTTSGGTEEQMNLVTMVFDHQDALRFETARQAAITFKDTALRPNTLVRVVVIGRKLYLLEQFTSDRNKIYKAIEKALGTSEKSFAEVSARKIEEITQLAEQVPNSASLTGVDNRSIILGSAQGTATEAILARLTLDTLLQSDKMLREVGFPSPVFPLLSIARNHRKLAGRKMVFYISNGLYLQNSGLAEILRNVVSEANQANLSFYAINTRQLLANTGGMNSRLESSTVINATQRPETGTVGTRDPFNSFQGRNAGGSAAFDSRSAFTAVEVRGRGKEINKQNPLTDLTENTGGFVVQNIIEISAALRQAVSELGIYYAVTYSPTKRELDGKFRQITVKIARHGLKAQTRNGYFAVPAASTRPVLTYEAPMLGVLSKSEVPRDFDYRDANLHFEMRANERHEVVLVEAPLKAFIQTEDKTKKDFSANLAILAIVKNAKNEIVQKFNETYTLEIPVTQLEEARQASLYLVRHCWLPLGSYTLETVVHDQKGNRMSGHRRPFTVTGSNTSLNAGSLYLVKQIEQVEAENIEAENPLFVGNYKVIPELADTITAQENAEIPFYVSIYPQLPIMVPPTLSIELSRAGKVVATTTPTLPKADEKGLLTFSAGIPTKGLESGAYRLRAIIKQGDATIEESLSFNLNGTGKVEAPEDNVKAINSTIAAPTDRVSELALVSLTAATAVELSVSKLLEETEKSGVEMHQRLGDYTYTLRKVRRTFDKKKRLRAEEYKDYEAYPVKGQHALVQMSANGAGVSSDRMSIDRKQATEALIQNEEEKQKADRKQASGSYWGAGIEGSVQGKNHYITLNPQHFFQSSEFSSPRIVLLDGRETIVMEFRPRAGVKLEPEKEWVRRVEGNVWIDVADKVLVRMEGQVKSGAATSTTQTTLQPIPHFVYQQQRVGVGLWAPALIRANSLGDATIFNGLNCDAWFEFSNFKRFDSTESDVKLTPPKEDTKKP